MVEVLEKSFEENKNKIAYKFNNDEITYGELWKESNEYADYLKKQGNSPVIIYGNKELYVVKTIIACLLANRIYVPIDSNMPIERLLKIIDISKASLIITDNVELKAKIDKISVLNLEELKNFNIQKIKNRNIYKKSENSQISNKKSDSDIAYIIFTSGTTGNPKGVPISKNNLKNFINWITSIKPLCDYENKVVFNQASFSFDLSVADFYYSLVKGHTLVAYDNHTSDIYKEINEKMKIQKANVAVMTPTFANMCLLDDKFNSENYSDLECIYFCGETLEKRTVKKLFDRFPKLNIINAYGPTETTSAVSAIMITKDILEKEEILPVGDTSNFATEISIDNGEIILKGKSVFNGYLDLKSDNYFKEDEVSCYRTGDIGLIKDNKLYCLGRKDSQVKFNGYRIELSDIEKNIKEMEYIQDCICVAIFNNENKVKFIKAFVILDSNIEKNSGGKIINDKSINEIISLELNKKLPKYMIPKIIKIVDSFPMNKNNKIDRKALQDDRY